jgi:phosphocarrier protein FPr/phosphocarrier protein
VTLEIRAPFTGWSSALTEIPDEVFARAMLGEGAALDPASGELRAPCDGEVISIAAALHAIALRAPCGAELLAHVGIDTVALDGEGFTVHVRKGDRVRAGDLLSSFDLDRVARRARSLVTPLIVTNGERFRIVRARLDRRLAVGETWFELEEVAPAVAPPTDRSRIESPAVSEAVVVAHAHGIHARPAAQIAKLAKASPHPIELRARGRGADARSAVALMSLGVRGGDEVVVVAFEAAAAPAVAAIARLIRNLDPGVPGPVPESVRATAPPAPPAVPGLLRGPIASRGFATGPAQRFECEEPPVVEAGEGVDIERARLERALGAVQARLRRRAAGEGAVAQIMGAHLELLEDPQLRTPADVAIAAGKSAAFAWRASTAASAAALRATQDARLAERTCDLVDLERQVLREIAGGDAPRIRLRRGAILVAHELTPSQLMDLEVTALAGIALAAGGATSHVAILAATLGVPMLVGLGAGVDAVADGADLILDAEAGELLTAPSSDALASAQARVTQARAQRSRDAAAATVDCHLASGERIEVFANLAGSRTDARLAVEQGAEGCGLLRTEFLFLERTTAPDEAEQLASYQQVADELGARPLVIRTLDVGGDKPIAYLPLPPEDNPALGLRGIRTSLWRPELLDVQLRALLRVRPAVHVLLPMITDVTEIEQVTQRLDGWCRAAGVPRPRLGAMIETPAAAMLADQVAGCVDFLSIGTNDLAQYGLAMDRGHAELAARIDGLHPAVLRLIAATTAGAARHRCPVAVCGGLASDPEAVPLLIGLGVTELSVVPALIARLKARIRMLTLDQCRELARQALELRDAAQVRDLVRRTLA